LCSKPRSGQEELPGQKAKFRGVLRVILIGVKRFAVARVSRLVTKSERGTDKIRVTYWVKKIYSMLFFRNIIVGANHPHL